MSKAKRVEIKSSNDVEELEAIMAEVSYTNESLAYRIYNGLYKKLAQRRAYSINKSKKYHEATKHIKK